MEAIGLVLAVGGVLLAVWMYRKQEAEAGIQARFLENFAANRHNSAGITFKGTTVRPGTGEALWEGFAPTVIVTPPSDTGTNQGQKPGVDS